MTVTQPGGHMNTPTPWTRWQPWTQLLRRQQQPAPPNNRPPITKTERNRRTLEARRVVHNTTPQTLCCNCNQPLHRTGPNHDGRGRNGKPNVWQAGHSDGRWPTNELRPECSFCNQSRGATDGNRTRTPTTETW